MAGVSRSRARSSASARAGAEELEVMALAASGRAAALRDRRSDGTDPTPWQLLAELDVAVRCYEAGTAEVERVASHLERLGSTPERHRWWLQAIRADVHVTDGDFLAAARVALILDELPADAVVPAELHYLRGRLRRTAALAALTGAAPRPTTPVEARGLRDAAIDDLLRGGFPTEVAVTRALWAAAQALLRWEEPRANLERLRDAYDEVDPACDPRWRAPLDYLLGATALLVGDLATTVTALDRLEEALGTDSPLAAVPAFSRLLAALAGADDRDPLLEEVDRRIGALRGVRPRLVKALQQQLANTLLDLGDARAERYALATLDMPPTSPIHAAELAVLELRLAMASGAAPDADHVKAVLEGIEQLGLGRLAGATALRLAADLRRLDGTAGAEADALRVWGFDRLPAPAERTFWESLWARAELRHDERGTGSTPAVRVLGPALAVEREGHPVEVRATVAKLLLVLVCNHPRPTHVEQAACALWPDAPLAVARRRLNTVVHRLRHALGTGDQVVQRRGELVELRPDDLDVDLFRYGEALRGPAEERRRALAGVRGNLCHVQFPYDEALIDHRHAFAATWVRHARTLVAERRAEVTDLEAALAALDLDAGDLVPSPGDQFTR